MITMRTLGRLKAMTARNDHGAAYEAAAQALGLQNLQEQFARINSEHRHLGDLSYEASQRRYRLYQELMAQAKSKLDAVRFEQFRMCF